MRDAISNRWTTFVGRVKNAMNLAERLKAKEGKTVKPKDKHIDLNLVESLFSSLFGKDIVNDKKPINKNAFAVRFAKSEEGYSTTKFVDIFYQAFIKYLEVQDLNTEGFTREIIESVIKDVQKS